MRVLLVSQGRPSFVERDAKILAKHFDLERFLWSGFRDLFRLRRAARRSDAVVCWFAEAHAGVAVQAARGRAVTIIGGYDVLQIPELGYGVPLRPFPIRRLALYALRKSDVVLAVDPSLIEAAGANLGIDTRHFAYLPTAYDAGQWRPDGAKERRVLTVAGVDRTTIERKGLRLFCEVARHLPDIPFVLAGALLDEAARRLEEQAPPNVRFLGRLDDEQLLREYQRSAVYAQFSVAEGLPNALCEAMLCGCVPLGTVAGGIVHAVGEAGFVSRERDPQHLARLVLQALDRPDLGAAARERARTLFRPELREAGLVEAVTGRSLGSNDNPRRSSLIR